MFRVTYGGLLQELLDDRAIAAEAERRGVVAEPMSKHLEAGSTRRGFMFGHES